MPPCRIRRRVLLVTTLLSGVLLLATTLLAGVLLLSRAGLRGAGTERGGVDHVTLAGSRIFECDGRARVACLEAALAASNAEVTALRASEGKRKCHLARVSETGGYCVSSLQPATGGNDYLDAGVTAALCAAAGAGASVLDLGCGVGHYERPLTSCNLTWRGFDGAASIEEATGGRVRWADLSVPIDVGASDWVLSLEVGEHLPQRFAATFVDNLVRHARRGILMSWALPEQVGSHHVNNRPQEAVVADFVARGFVLDVEGTRAMRAAVKVTWLRHTALLFVRGDAAIPAV